MFSVASSFDDSLPQRIAGMEVDELFGSCDDAPVGHGRPRAMIPPVTWRTLARHVAACRTAGIGFNLLRNPICLGGYEENVGLERRIRRAMARALDMGVTQGNRIQIQRLPRHQQQRRRQLLQLNQRRQLLLRQRQRQRRVLPLCAWALDIIPSAGVNRTQKNGVLSYRASSRSVPRHPALLEQSVSTLSPRTSTRGDGHRPTRAFARYALLR